MKKSNVERHDYLKKRRDLCILMTFILIFACIKLLLISGEEVIARNQGYDDLWHIMAAFRGYWLGDGYNHMMFVHLPVYSIWIALVHFTGIPLRIGTELLYLAASVVFLLAVLRTGLPRWLGMIIFIFILFHPVSYSLFDYVLAETVYGSLFIMSIAGFITLWSKREQADVARWAILTGIICALLWNLRKENLLLILLFAVLVGFRFYEQFRDGGGWIDSGVKSLVFVRLPIALVALFTLAIMSANYVRFGMFVPTEFSSPGYKAAYRALLRIDPPHSVRFVPVPAEVRKIAYSVSPSFKELAWCLEGDLGRQAAAETRRHMKIDGEIAAGWFYWTLRDAAAASGHFGTALEADAYFQRIADEINGAIDSGALPGRRVLATFIDPEPANYLPYIPSSLKKICRLFVSTDAPSKLADDPGISSKVHRAFDLMANRRVALVSPEVLTVQGWAFSEKKRLARVDVRNCAGEVLTSSTLMAREDIAKAYGGQWGSVSTLQSGFQMGFPLNGCNPKDLLIVFVGQDGSETMLPYAGIRHDTPIQKQTTTQGTLMFALDSNGESPLYKKLAVAQAMLWRGYGRMVMLLTCLGFVALLILAVFPRRLDVWSPRFLAIILLIVAVFSRIALFTLLDASSWPGDQPRYLFPVMPLYSCLLLLIIYEAWFVIKRARI